MATADTWRPRNLGGTIRDDPRDELLYWANSVPDGQPMVAVPVATLLAAAAVRVCRSSVVSTADEDGPMPPQTLHCNRPEGHLTDHSNGYLTWANRPEMRRA